MSLKEKVELLRLVVFTSLGTLFCALCIVFLIPSTSSAQWSTNLWPATDELWIKSAHVIELHDAVNERYNVVNGTNWPDRVTNAWWIKKEYINDAIDILETLAPDFVDTNAANTNGVFPPTTTVSIPLIDSWTNYTWATLKENALGTNVISCADTNDNVGWWICGDLLDDIKAIVNDMVWLEVEGSLGGTNYLSTNLIGFAEIETNETATASFWTTNAWPNRSMSPSWPGAAFADHASGPTNQVIYRETYISTDWSNTDCSGTVLNVSTNISTNVVCGAGMPSDTNTCTDAFTIGIEDDYTYTLLSSETDPCNFETAYTNLFPGAGSGWCDDGLCNNWEAIRHANTFVYTIPSTNYTGQGYIYHHGSVIDNETHDARGWTFDPESFITGTLGFGTQQLYSASAVILSNTTAYVEEDFATNSIPYAAGVQSNWWGVNTGGMLIKYNEHTNGFQYVE